MIVIAPLLQVGVLKGQKKQAMKALSRKDMRCPRQRAAGFPVGLRKNVDHPTAPVASRVPARKVRGNPTNGGQRARQVAEPTDAVPKSRESGAL